jgi:hypothetical protein
MNEQILQTFLRRLPQENDAGVLRTILASLGEFVGAPGVSDALAQTALRDGISVDVRVGALTLLRQHFPLEGVTTETVGRCLAIRQTTSSLIRR